MTNNNLFQYATKELSQDAFLCWSINWINYPGHPLCAYGKAMLDLFLGDKKLQQYYDVKICRQYKKIDVLVLFRDVAGKSYALIIEDKTNTSEHGNQMERYKEELLPAIKNDKDETIKQYEDPEILLSYVKTAEYIKADDAICRNNEIVKLTRSDILSLIEPYIEKSEILFDYYTNLKALDDAYAETDEAFLNYNYNEALRYSHMQWRYIKESFSEENEKGILELPCDMSLPKGLDPIEQGTSFGTPYTWYWFLEFSRNTKEEERLKFGRYLGYRIDTDDEGTFISLRMYCRYDKADENAKELQKKTLSPA